VRPWRRLPEAPFVVGIVNEGDFREKPARSRRIATASEQRKCLLFFGGVVAVRSVPAFQIGPFYPVVDVCRGHGFFSAPSAKQDNAAAFVRRGSAGSVSSPPSSSSSTSICRGLSIYLRGKRSSRLRLSRLIIAQLVSSLLRRHVLFRKEHG